MCNVLRAPKPVVFLVFVLGPRARLLPLSPLLLRSLSRSSLLAPRSLLGRLPRRLSRRKSKPTPRRTKGTRRKHEDEDSSGNDEHGQDAVPLGEMKGGRLAPHAKKRTKKQAAPEEGALAAQLALAIVPAEAAASGSGGMPPPSLLPAHGGKPPPPPPSLPPLQEDDEVPPVRLEIRKALEILRGEDYGFANGDIVLTEKLLDANPFACDEVIWTKVQVPYWRGLHVLAELMGECEAVKKGIKDQQIKSTLTALKSQRNLVIKCNLQDMLRHLDEVIAVLTAAQTMRNEVAKKRKAPDIQDLQVHFEHAITFRDHLQLAFPVDWVMTWVLFFVDHIILSRSSLTPASEAQLLRKVALGSLEASGTVYDSLSLDDAKKVEAGGTLNEEAQVALQTSRKAVLHDIVGKLMRFDGEGEKTSSRYRAFLDAVGGDIESIFGQDQDRCFLASWRCLRVFSASDLRGQDAAVLLRIACDQEKELEGFHPHCATKYLGKRFRISLDKHIKEVKTTAELQPAVEHYEAQLKELASAAERVVGRDAGKAGHSAAIICV